jgi:predicted enzyme related to lactoylglutathione lyase
MHENEPVMANHTGFTHIAFEVEDVEKIFNDALKSGAIKLGEITEKIIEGVGVLKFVYFRDPEGNIVEIQSWEK